MSVEVKQIDHDNFEVTVSSDAVTYHKVKIFLHEFKELYITNARVS